MTQIYKLVQMGDKLTVAYIGVFFLLVAALRSTRLSSHNLTRIKLDIKQSNTGLTQCEMQLTLRSQV